MVSEISSSEYAIDDTLSRLRNLAQKQEDQGKIDLYYFDESGFTLDPYIPYAWQEPGTVIEIPVRKCGRINVLGFMNRKNDLHPFIFEQSVHTSVVIACFEAFSQTLKKKRLLSWIMLRFTPAKNLKNVSLDGTRR